MSYKSYFNISYRATELNTSLNKGTLHGIPKLATKTEMSSPITSRFFRAVHDQLLPALFGGPRPVQQRSFASDTEGSQGVTLRRGRMEDVPGVWQVTEEAKWNMHQDVVETHFKMSNNGWIIAEKDGNIVGCLLTYKFNDDLRTAGHLIMSPKMRGYGVGGKLMMTFLEEFGDANVHASLTKQMFDTYERYTGVPLSMGKVVGKYSGVFKNTPLPPDAERSYRLLDVTKIDQSDLIDYDASYHGVPRPEKLKLWLGQTTAETLVLLEKGKIAGYGSIRPAMNGFSLGPLYAENTIGTMVLFKALVDLIPRDSNVDILMPYANEAGQEILKANESTVKLFDTYQKFALKCYSPPPKWNNVFSLFSNACGKC
ncbi:uncharacterized protein LOC106177675 [Lingula anatina]|uniref:Uncharacterized protein LOC106177675 n=1 Tax=Lingula anatina TaxID=7574 RepID=A0A1S3K003_LINAN|nr:uncharacterized protein LOC106177675 [Lingula anatina]|eukprot:XP_013415975.1 uncharacterized protein LOC106177675 [Lingula anatina]